MDRCTPTASCWMKYQLSKLWYANSGKLLIEKTGRIYVLEKNSFICIERVLKKNPCD